MPWRSLLIVYSVILSDAMVVLIIMPFVPVQCRERWNVPEEWVGSATGAILGAFSLSSFLSSFYLGHLSDHCGRKPLVCCGLLAGCLGLLSYGLSTNFYWAFASLFLPGLVNSNVSIVRAICSDLTLLGEQRTLAMGHINACFSLSRFVSSSIGGFLVMEIGGLPLFEDNAFLLPCVLGSLANLACLAWVAIGLEETLSRRGPEVASDVEGISNDGTEETMDLWRSLAQVARDPLLVCLMACFAAGSFSSNGTMVALSLLYALPTKDDGMGFGTGESGAAYAWMALAGLFFQIFVFRKALQRLGLWRMCRASILLLAVCLVLLPLWSAFSARLELGPGAHSAMVWMPFLLVSAVTAMCLSCSSAVLAAMQSNACPHDQQGLVMGLNGSLGSLLRALGPFVVGLSFVFPLVAFGLLALVLAASLVVLSCLPAHLVWRTTAATANQ